MENNSRKIADLLLLEIQGKLTSEQRKELDEYARASAQNERMRSNLTDIGYLSSRLQDHETAELSKAEDWQKLRSKTTAIPVPAAHRVHFLRTAWFRYASAVIIIATGISAWFFANNKKPFSTIARMSEDTIQTNIGPGGHGAILTLANGKTVLLDSLANGLIADQEGAKVVLDKGLLAYDPSGNMNRAEELVYNTLVIPKGRQFQLMLPDGSKVWLNSASSLRYPVSFNGDTRTVEMTGEGYFEVAKNTKPFYVKVNDIKVVVMGTGFNIMAYEDEDMISTTLAEGMVKVMYGETAVIIKPGQQASLPDGGDRFQISTPDLDQVLSWKNGQISFTSAALPVVMRQISRWYDIDIDYEGAVPTKHFNGIIDQNLHLRDVLKVLTVYGIHFRLDGRKLTVLP